MEEETKSAGNSNKRLLEFLGDSIPNNGFNVGADICIKILSELGWYQVWKQTSTKREEQHSHKNIESTPHLFKTS